MAKKKITTSLIENDMLMSGSLVLLSITVIAFLLLNYIVAFIFSIDSLSSFVSVVYLWKFLATALVMIVVDAILIKSLIGQFKTWRMYRRLLVGYGR